MSHFNLSLTTSWYRTSSAVVMAMAMAISTFTAPGQARPKPPSQGSYVTQTGGASRGCGDSDRRMMTALVPTEITGDPDDIFPNTSTGGFTSQSHPDFWFHIPFTSQELTEVEFVLQERQGNNNTNLYRIPLDAPTEAGLVKVSVPKVGSGLASGKRYRWFLKATLACDIAGRPEPSLQQVRGWIEQYSPEPDLASQLAAASPQEQAQLYSDAGYWFDAVEAIASLRSSNPSNSTVKQDWETLLETYQLSENLAQAEFVDCCTTASTETSRLVEQ